MKKMLGLIAVLIVAELLLAGCTSTQPPAGNATGSTVAIQNFAFNPATLTVKAGATVKWTNEDAAPHQINSGTFNSQSLNTGDSFEFKFDTPGAYNYTCSIHPSMKGAIVVQ